MRVDSWLAVGGFCLPQTLVQTSKKQICESKAKKRENKTTTNEMLKQLKLCSIAFLRLQLNEMENFNCSVCMYVYGCGCGCG